jgi:hypothetical protein
MTQVKDDVTDEIGVVGGGIRLWVVGYGGGVIPGQYGCGGE